MQSAQSAGDFQRLVEEGQLLLPHQGAALPEDGHGEVGPSPGVNHAVQEALQRHRGGLKKTVRGILVWNRRTKWQQASLV